MNNTGNEIRMIRHDNYAKVRAYDGDGKPFRKEIEVNKEHLTPVEDLFSPSPAVTPQQEGDDLDIQDEPEILSGPQEPMSTPQPKEIPTTPNMYAGEEGRTEASTEERTWRRTPGNHDGAIIATLGEMIELPPDTPNTGYYNPQGDDSLHSASELHEMSHDTSQYPDYLDTPMTEERRRGRSVLPMVPIRQPFQPEMPGVPECPESSQEDVLAAQEEEKDREPDSEREKNRGVRRKRHR